MGEQLCAVLIPFIAVIEVVIFAFVDCFDCRPPPIRHRGHNLRQLARGSRCFSVNDVEALYELYKKLSFTIIDDGLIYKEELQLALFNNPSGENLFLDRRLGEGNGGKIILKLQIITSL